jgi:hypothetical protein
LTRFRDNSNSNGNSAITDYADDADRSVGIEAPSLNEPGAFGLAVRSLIEGALY